MYCIIQARCGSKRLKRKVFKRINNQMIIERVINQLKNQKKLQIFLLLPQNINKMMILKNFVYQKN